METKTIRLNEIADTLRYWREEFFDATGKQLTFHTSGSMRNFEIILECEGKYMKIPKTLEKAIKVLTLPI